MIGETIGEVLAFGVGVALSPLAIVAAVVMLVAPGGVSAAWAYLCGWLASIALVCTAVVLLADGAAASASDGPATWVSVAKIVVGLLLAGFGVRQWRARSSDESEPEAPGWMRKLDGITAPRALGLGAVFGVVKPKNLLLTIGAGLAVAQVGASPGAQAVGVAGFVILGSTGLAIPYAVHVLMPRHGNDRLIRIRDWMVDENATVIAVLCLVLAAKLLGDALISLSG